MSTSAGRKLFVQVYEGKPFFMSQKTFSEKHFSNKYLNPMIPSVKGKQLLVIGWLVGIPVPFLDLDIQYWGMVL